MLNKISIPGVEDNMLTSDYWINKIENSNSIVLNSSEICQFNERTFLKVSSMCRVFEYKESISGGELKNIIEEYKIPEEIRFDINGEVVNSEFYYKLLLNTNLDKILEFNTVRFGVAVRSTRVRSFPTNEGIFSNKQDKEFDRFQETECQAIEPVSILHESLDGKWFFIQLYNYKGWVAAEDIAVGKSKKEIFDYVNNEEFLVVIGNRIRTQFNHYDPRISQKDFYMGTKLPLENKEVLSIGNQSAANNYVVKLPVRDREGYLEIVNALISVREEVHLGYLPYTRANILNQAFKLLGDRYDWGNKNNGRDCSGLLLCVYKSCGVILPRNGDEQEIAEGIHYVFDKNDTVDGRKKVFQKVFPGAGIFMDGHVMIYIGEDKGEYFMIHAFHRYGVNLGNEEFGYVNANEVAVTPVLLLTSKGEKFIRVFTSIVQYE